MPKTQVKHPSTDNYGANSLDHEARGCMTWVQENLMAKFYGNWVLIVLYPRL